jgi:hypothetical protein
MAIDHSLQPERLILHAAEAEAHCGCDDHSQLVEEMSATLDDRTIRYVLETRPHFEDLRHAIGQVAGMLVLATAGAKTVTSDHPLLATARATLERAGGSIDGAGPSARAVHHHRHLLSAVDALGLALDRAGENLHLLCLDRMRVDHVLEPLQIAYRHLAWAAQALPGFGLLNLDQACCAPQQPGKSH